MHISLRILGPNIPAKLALDYLLVFHIKVTINYLIVKISKVVNNILDVTIYAREHAKCSICIMALDLPQNIYSYSLFASEDTVSEKHEAVIAVLQR